jgi:hypothetical protein
MSSHRFGAIFGPGAGYGHDPRHTGGPSATSAIEWRVDTSDGCAYTKVEFERFYGLYSGTCKWKAALQAMPAPRQYRAKPAADATTTSAIERRVDSSDGCAYTKVEFERFHGLYSGTGQRPRCHLSLVSLVLGPAAHTPAFDHVSTWPTPDPTPFSCSISSGEPRQKITYSRTHNVPSPTVEWLRRRLETPFLSIGSQRLEACGKRFAKTFRGVVKRTRAPFNWLV